MIEIEILYYNLEKKQIITYIHDQNEFLTKTLPKPIKTAINTIYT